MNRLKYLRKEKGLSQKAFSEEIGVSYRTIQNWENGESQIKPDKAQQLADYFGVSVGYLLGYDINNIIKDTGQLDNYVELDALDITKEVTFRGEKLSDKQLEDVQSLVRIYMEK